MVDRYRIKANIQGLDLPGKALGDVLALMLETKTCLIARDGRVWRIRLMGINDPASPLFRKFCAEAATTVVDVDSFVSALNTRPERTVRPSRTRPGQGAAPVPRSGGA